MDEDNFAEEEMYLYDCIRRIQREYEAAAAPFVKRLVDINAARAPRYVVPYEVIQEITKRANVLDSL